MQQSGFDGFVTEARSAVFARARTPAPILARCHEALAAGFREPHVVETITTAQQARVVLASAEDTARFIARAVETWARWRTTNRTPD